MRNSEDTSALIFSIQQRGQSEMAALLIEAGTSIHLTPSWGFNAFILAALSVATQFGHTGVKRALLARLVQSNARTSSVFISCSVFIS